MADDSTIEVNKDLYNSLLAMYAAEVEHTSVKDSLWIKEKAMRAAMAEVQKLLPPPSGG